MIPLVYSNLTGRGLEGLDLAGTLDKLEVVCIIQQYSNTIDPTVAVSRKTKSVVLFTTISMDQVGT